MRLAVSAELQKLKLNIRDKKIADLAYLPEMADLEKKACMSFLTNLNVAAFNTSPDLLSWITLKRVNISLNYGNTETSCYSYVMLGALFGSEVGNENSGYEFGKLALKLNNKSNVVALASKVYHIFGSAIHPWHEHIKLSLPLLKKAYQLGLDSGDLLFAGFAFGQVICHRLMKGDDLISVCQESEKCLTFYRQTKDETQLNTALVWQHCCLNLQGLTKNKYTLSTEVLDESQHLEKLQKNGSSFGLNWYYIIKLQILFIYEKYADALKMAIELENIAAIPGELAVVEHIFYYSLTIAALYDTESAESKKKSWEILEKNQARMKMWADKCPDNFSHKHLLIAAEMMRVSTNKLAAMKLYDQAIKSAQSNEYTQNVAIANELAAKFYLANGFDTIAKTYMMEARYSYAKWGATAKIKDLESRHPQLLSITPVREITGIEVSTPTTYTTSADTRVLDLTTVIKASLALSSEIVLGRLLDKLIRIVMENAGAQTGFLISKKESKLMIEAEATVNRDQVKGLQSVPLESSYNLPISIIKYVERTRENFGIG